jgi:hypothetical protein
MREYDCAGRRQSARGDPVMRTQMPALAIMAVVGFGSQAHAQAPCPELTRLRSETAVASKQTIGIPTPERCKAYIRFSEAWSAVVQYANGHREACDISTLSLNELKNYQHEADKARDNVCGGRPARPFPPDIIRR